MHHITTHATQLAALTDGSDLKAWILAVVGNLFAAFFAIRAFGHFIKKDWGEMVTMCVAAVLVAATVWDSAAVLSVLSGIWGKVSGAA